MSEDRHHMMWNWQTGKQERISVERMFTNYVLPIVDYVRNEQWEMSSGKRVVGNKLRELSTGK